MTSYEVLKNRLTNGRPYTVEAAVARITALADALEITQDQANELTALAQQYGSAASQDTEARLQQLEAASLEHDAALIELAGQLALLLADKEADQAPRLLRRRPRREVRHNGGNLSALDQKRPYDPG